jgi:asparagine synthase (glutamine-hydrolysing)
MCGIAGIIRFDGNKIDKNIMDGMLQKISHRGKDYSQIVSVSSKTNVELGHRRLAIIELSDTAVQPMMYDDGSIWLTFNGEIYNYVELRAELLELGYKFRTMSDTEVILVAYRHWGDKCVEHLNGMFAFALWDEINQRLFCARDQLGIKPFYFYHTESFLAFASESRALEAFHCNRLDADGLAAYLLSSYVPVEFSIFDGVEKLLPAHTMIVQPSGKVECKKYWNITKVSEYTDSSSSMEITALLEQAVMRQVRSDVPVGALLSGGVDSGMIVALASKHIENMHTYSVGFEGAEINELDSAAAVANKYGTFHHQKILDDEDAIQYLDLALKNLSEPIADPAIIPSYVLSEMAAKDGVKVLLSGTGGDEIFGGYDRYSGGKTYKRRLLNVVPNRVKKIIGRVLPISTKLGALLRNPSLDMMFTTNGCFDLFSNMMEGPKMTEELLLKISNSIPSTVNDRGHLLYKQMNFDMSVYMPDGILFLFDQMTMANTVEGRVPLLDVDLVEKAFMFPPSSHVNSGRTKVLFRNIAEQYLGHKHVWQQKHGFSGPVPYWINKNTQYFSDSIRYINNIPGLENLDIGKYLILLEKNELNTIDSFAIFTLYCLQKWYDSQVTDI